MNESVELDLRQGEQAVLYSGDQPKELTIAPLSAQAGETNHYGFPPSTPDWDAELIVPIFILLLLKSKTILTFVSEAKKGRIVRRRERGFLV